MSGNTYYTSIRTHKIKKELTIPDTGKDVEKMKILYIAGGNVNCADILENSLVITSKKKKKKP